MIRNLFVVAALLTASPCLHAVDNLPDLGSRVVEERAAQGTPAASTPAPFTQAPIADLAEAQQVQAELQALIRAYETGNINALQNHLDPAMIGYQRFVDGVIRDNTLLKQVRVNLFDTQVLAGPDVAVIQTGWEKRFLSLTGFQPGLFTGRSTFLLHRDKDQWKIAAFAGDNLFASQSGVLAQLTASPAVFTAPAGGCAICPTISITLLDPDLAGQGTVAVELISSQNDRESLTLTATTPGRFIGTITTQIDNGTPMLIGSGVVDINSNPALLPVNITVRYRDQNPGSNRPPSYVSQTLRAVP
jgi:hypothetical protein